MDGSKLRFDHGAEAYLRIGRMVSAHPAAATAPWAANLSSPGGREVANFAAARALGIVARDIAEHVCHQFRAALSGGRCCAPRRRNPNGKSTSPGDFVLARRERDGHSQWSVPSLVFRRERASHVLLASGASCLPIYY